jgi:site-specific recombinase XerD
MQSDTPIVDHILPFLDYCEIEKGLSNNTQRNYRQYLRVFEHWLKTNDRADLLAHELTADDVWNYRLYLARTYTTPAGHHLTKKSQNYYLIALRALLNYFADRDVDSLPASKVKLAKQQSQDHITFLDINDVERILAISDTSTTKGLRDRAIMELLFSSGMRVAELVNLDIDSMSVLNDNSTDRTYELTITGKGNRVRTIFISPRAADWLREYIATRRDVFKPLFINTRSKNPERKRLSARYIQNMISRCALQAGLSKRVTPHTLRHTYATDLLAHGADLRSVQELLGHKNVSTTQVYTHVTNKQLRDIHEKYHGGHKDDE